LKEWKRVWKLQLIESSNPEWKDLYGETCEQDERSLIFRHPDVSRDPDFPHGYWLKAWVPAFAGMTELTMGSHTQKAAKSGDNFQFDLLDKNCRKCSIPVTGHEAL
jgi:hypothetical protein